jgi:hypothetical protein
MTTRSVDHRDRADSRGTAEHQDADAIPDANEEGPLTWERVDSLDELPMWEGDRYLPPASKVYTEYDHPVGRPS